MGGNASTGKKTAAAGPTKAGRGRPPISDKQIGFIDEYMLDGNGTQAAIRAGYSPRTAREQASDLLSKPNIRAEVERRKAARLDKYEVTADRVIRGLALRGFSTMADYVPLLRSGSLDELEKDPDRAAAITSVKLNEDGKISEFKLADARAALVDLGKIVGVFRDGAEINMPVTFNILNGPV